MPSERRRDKKRRARRARAGSPSDNLLFMVIERLTALARAPTSAGLTDEQAAEIDRIIRKRITCPMRPCREILAALETMALGQMCELERIVAACRDPLAPPSVRMLARAASVFEAERVRGHHVGSVVCESSDVAASIRELARRPPR